MAFYAFSLDAIETVFQRGKIDDVDVVTFTVLDALKSLWWSIQIKETGTTNAGDGESEFEANWKRGKVTAELTEYRVGKGVSRLIETTQGKVYETLLRGDPFTLESDELWPSQKCGGSLEELPVYVPLEQEALPASPTESPFQKPADLTLTEAANSVRLVQATLF
jgi:hypothetical protein